MYVTVRASGACARSVASLAARRSRSAAGRRLACVGAPAHERERVGEEQRAAEREHELAHDLVVEAHTRRRLPPRPTVPHAASGRSRAPAPRSRAVDTPRCTEPRDPLVDVAGRPHDALARSGTPSAARHTSVSTPRSGSCPCPVASTRKQRGPLTRDRRARRPGARRTRPTDDRDPQHLRRRERRAGADVGARRTVVHEIAVVASGRPVDRHRRTRDAARATPAFRAFVHDLLRSTRPSASVRVKS